MFEGLPLTQIFFFLEGESPTLTPNIRNYQHLAQYQYLSIANTFFSLSLKITLFIMAIRPSPKKNFHINWNHLFSMYVKLKLCKFRKKKIPKQDHDSSNI